MATKKTPSTKTPSTKTPGKTATKKSAAASAAPAAAVATEQVETAVAASKDSMEAVVKTGTQAATKSYEQAVAMAQEQVEKTSTKIFEGYDEFASLGKDTVDAYVESSTVFTNGIEALSRELVIYTQVAVEANVAATKAIFGARSVQEVIDLQTDYSRSSFDSLVAESAKLTGLSMTLASDTLEPIHLRINAAVGKMMKPLAA